MWIRVIDPLQIFGLSHYSEAVIMNICTMGVAAGRMEGRGITSQKPGGNDPTSPLFLIQPGKKSSPGKDNPLDIE